MFHQAEAGMDEVILFFVKAAMKDCHGFVIYAIITLIVNLIMI